MYPTDLHIRPRARQSSDQCFFGDQVAEDPGLDLIQRSDNGETEALDRDEIDEAVHVRHERDIARRRGEIRVPVRRTSLLHALLPTCPFPVAPSGKIESILPPDSHWPGRDAGRLDNHPWWDHTGQFVSRCRRGTN